jgi:hypothetical protein
MHKSKKTRILSEIDFIMNHRVHPLDYHSLVILQQIKREEEEEEEEENLCFATFEHSSSVGSSFWKCFGREN